MKDIIDPRAGPLDVVRVEDVPRRVIQTGDVAERPGGRTLEIEYADGGRVHGQVLDKVMDQGASEMTRPPRDENAFFFEECLHRGACFVRERCPGS